MEAIEVLYVGSYGLVGRRITEVTSTSYVIRLRKQKKNQLERNYFSLNILEFINQKQKVKQQPDVYSSHLTMHRDAPTRLCTSLR